MIEPESHERLRREISERITADRALLDGLRAEIRPLRAQVTRIQPRTTTSISLVGTDGGNNSLHFDPFLVQVVRVVLARYRLAMAIERVMTTNYPAYVEVPREIEEKAYIWSEFARGDDRADEGGEINKFVGGKMFLVKFGSNRRDPIWPIDIFTEQKEDAQVILGSMLADAINGFPVPHYPRCLQKAHENAALVDFDFDILQDYIYEGVRGTLGEQSTVLDVFQLQD